MYGPSLKFGEEEQNKKRQSSATDMSGLVDIETLDLSCQTTETMSLLTKLKYFLYCGTSSMISNFIRRPWKTRPSRIFFFQGNYQTTSTCLRLHLNFVVCLIVAGRDWPLWQPLWQETIQKILTSSSCLNGIEFFLLNKKQMDTVFCEKIENRFNVATGPTHLKNLNQSESGGKWR